MENGRGEILRIIDKRHGAEKVDIHLNRLAAGGPNGKIHHHSQSDNVYIVRSGQGRLIVEDVEHTIREGQVVYIPAGMRHSLSNVSSAPFEVFEIYAPGGAAFDFIID
jgi:mannose-6-phosphate isomerase-like protein (cupin superfamily)